MMGGIRIEQVHISKRPQPSHSGSREQLPRKKTQKLSICFPAFVFEPHIFVDSSAVKLTYEVQRGNLGKELA
jgi:hypothetical protein